MEDGLVGNASGKGAFQNKNTFFTFVVRKPVGVEHHQMLVHAYETVKTKYRHLSSTHTPPPPPPQTPPWELQELEAVAAAMRSDDALDVADRKYHGFTYKQCFLGKPGLFWPGVPGLRTPLSRHSSSTTFLLHRPPLLAGSEAVTWLREYLLQSGQGDTSAAAAVGLGQRLLQAGFIAHVTKKHSFKDEELFYVFGQP